MMNTHPPTLATLYAAATGLFVPSEQDAPLTPFTWTEAVPFCAPALLNALGMPPTTLVASTTVDAFFDPLIREKAHYSYP